MFWRGTSSIGIVGLGHGHKKGKFNENSATGLHRHLLAVVAPAAANLPLHPLGGGGESSAGAPTTARERGLPHSPSRGSGSPLAHGLLLPLPPTILLAAPGKKDAMSGFHHAAGTSSLPCPLA